MKRVLFSLAAALALAVPSFAQVAQIGDTTYDTLSAAFAAVQDDQTISLLQDIETDTQIVVPGGKDIILDLNGHTYTFNPTGGNNFYAFFLQQVNVSDPAVSLTIEDTSTEQTGTIKASGKANACISATDAALTIHGGRFVQEGTFEYALFVSEGLVIDPAEGQTVEFPSGGVHIRRASISPYKEEGATITGGDFTGDVYYALYVGETSGGTTVNISGGTFNAGKSGSSVCFDVPAIANISGGDFSSGSLSITPDGEGTKLAVTGGTFISENGYALYEGIAQKSDGTPAAEASTAVISITNGTFTGSKTNETITADIAITTAKDKQVVSGGTFNKMPDDALLTPGFVFVPQEDGTFGVIEGSYIASIGDVKYADFNSFFAAFKAIEGSEKPTTVTLLADLTGELAVPGVVPVKAGRNIVFDLNGHTMETALQQGSSTIRARGVSNFAQGNLTVESGTLVAIDSDGRAALWNEGDAIVSGGKLLVEDLVGNLPAIRNEVKATLVVKGGEVQGQSRPAVINVGTMTIEGGLLWNTQCNVTSDGKHKSPWYYAVLVGGNANASLKMIGGTIRGTQGALTFIAGKGELTGGRCETVPCIYHGDTGGNIWHALYLSTTEGPVDVTVGGDFVAQSNGREAFVIGGNNEDTQKYTCKATVTGGTFIGDEESGFAALRVNNQRKDGVEPIIQGGHFEGGIESVADTGFEPITNFVSGGTFSEAVELGCCAEGFIPVVGTEGKYTVDGTAVAAVANTETPGTYKGYGTLAALVGEAANGTEVLIVKPGNLGEGADLLKTATGGDNAISDTTAYDVAETLGGTFKVQDGAIVYAYQLGIADLDVTESGISVTVRLEEDGTAVTRTLEGRKVRVVSDKTVLAEADAIFTDGACVLTVPAANLPAGYLALTISVAPAAEAETLAE